MVTITQEMFYRVQSHTRDRWLAVSLSLLLMVGANSLQNRLANITEAMPNQLFLPLPGTRKLWFSQFQESEWWLNFQNNISVYYGHSVSFQGSRQW